MNVPVTPTVELSSLANLEKIDTDLAKRSGASWKSVAKPLAFAGAGLLAWRFAPLLAEAVRPKRRSKTPWIVAGVGLAVGAGALAWQLQRLFTAEPEHDVEERRGDLEIRRYGRVKTARTTVSGGWDEALNEGFGRLASFIFGSNAEKKKIAMTAPVTGTKSDAGYEIEFVMPEGVTPPTPDDDRIFVADRPARRVAVLRFNGRYDGESVEAKKRELLATVEENGYSPLGAGLSFAVLGAGTVIGGLVGPRVIGAVGSRGAIVAGRRFMPMGRTAVAVATG